MTKKEDTGGCTAGLEQWSALGKEECDVMGRATVGLSMASAKFHLKKQIYQKSLWQMSTCVQLE